MSANPVCTGRLSPSAPPTSSTPGPERGRAPSRRAGAVPMRTPPLFPSGEPPGSASCRPPPSLLTVRYHEGGRTFVRGRTRMDYFWWWLAEDDYSTLSDSYRLLRARARSGRIPRVEAYLQRGNGPDAPRAPCAGTGSSGL